MTSEPVGDRADSRPAHGNMWAMEMDEFITASPSPYHAVATATYLLDEAGFEKVDRAAPAPPDVSETLSLGEWARSELAGAFEALERPIGIELEVTGE